MKYEYNKNSKKWKKEKSNEYKKSFPYTEYKIFNNEPNTWVKKQEEERNTKFKAFCKSYPKVPAWFNGTTKMFNSEMVSIWLVILFCGLNEFVSQDLRAGTGIYLGWNIVKALVWTNLVLNFLEYKPNRKV